MNIYVANLNFDLRDEDLKNLFTPFGEVISAKIVMDKTSDRSRGFGFVEMADKSAGQQAITDLNGTSIEGRSITVNEAKPKTDSKFGGRDDRNYNSSRGYNQKRY